MRILRSPPLGSGGRRTLSPKPEQGQAADAGIRSTPRFQSFQDLVVLAGARSGFPQMVWVQEKDAFGKRMWEMTAKRVRKRGRKPKMVYDRTGAPVMVLKRDSNGDPIPVMKRVRQWKGDDQLLGYLMGLAQEYPQLYVSLIKHVRPTTVKPLDHDEPRAVRTLDDLREVLTKLGLPVDYLMSELKRDITPGPPPSMRGELDQYLNERGQPEANPRPRPALRDEPPAGPREEYDERGNRFLPDDQQPPDDEVYPVRVAERYYKNESIDADREVDPVDDFRDDDRYR